MEVIGGDRNLLLGAGAMLALSPSREATDVAGSRPAGIAWPLDGNIGRTGHGCQGRNGSLGYRRHTAAPGTAPSQSSDHEGNYLVTRRA